MIELIPSPQEDLLEFRISGMVTDRDYRNILIPALERAIAAAERVRVLVRIDEDFEGYTPGALLDDARLGLKHWNGFDRVAVVTDRSWIARAVRAFSVLMPGPVAVFSLAEHEDAKRWLRESLGSIHQIDLGGGVLQVQLIGKLDSAVYAEESEDLNAFIRANPRFRLLLDLREFDGWQGLAAIGAHLKVVRDHKDLVERIAVVGTNAFEHLAQQVGKRLLKVEAKYFDADAFDAAKAWVAG